jgi:hypothetical protein
LPFDYQSFEKENIHNCLILVFSQANGPLPKSRGPFIVGLRRANEA